MRLPAVARSLKRSRVRESADTDHILRDKMSFQIPPFAIRSFYVSVTWCTNSPSIYLQLQKVFELNLKVHTYFKHDTPCKIKLYKVRKGGNHLSFAKNILWISLQLDMISIKSLLRVLTWSNAFNPNENYNWILLQCTSIMILVLEISLKNNFHFQNCA